MRSLLWEWVSRYPAASILVTCIEGPERLGAFPPYLADHTTERTAANGGTARESAAGPMGGVRFLR
jgi:hypothetical protein